MGDPEGSPASLARGPRPSPELRMIEVTICCPVGPADIPGFWERVRAQIEGSDADAVVCDVAGLVDPDVATIDSLARLQLTARRSGCRIRLRRACDGLRDLLVLVGLSDVVPLAPGSPLEAGGQAEEREQPGGVEEEADPRDPIT